METHTPERIRLMGWVPRTDFLSALSGTFGQMVRLSREAGHENYLGDLYHDSVQLRQLVTGMVNAGRDEVGFYFLARESGTAMWPDAEQTATYREVWPGAAIWHFTVLWENAGHSSGDGVWFVTIERVA